MRQRAVQPLCKLPEEPDIGGEEADGGLHPKISLFVNPGRVDRQQQGTGYFGGIGDIGERGRINGVTAMAASEIIKIYGVEGGLVLGIFVNTPEGVIGEARQRGIFEVVNEKGHVMEQALPDHLPEDIPGLAHSRLSHNDGAGVDVEVDDAFMGLTAVSVRCLQMDAFRVLEEPFLLWKRFVSIIEHAGCKEIGDKGCELLKDDAQAGEPGEGGDYIENVEIYRLGCRQEEYVAAEIQDHTQGKGPNDGAFGHWMRTVFEAGEGNQGKEKHDQLCGCAMVERTGQVSGELRHDRAGELPAHKGAVAEIIEMQAEKGQRQAAGQQLQLRKCVI